MTHTFARTCCGDGSGSTGPPGGRARSRPPGPSCGRARQITRPGRPGSRIEQETDRTRAEWESWFQPLFSELNAVQADTDSTITNYQVLAGSDMAMSVVEFNQSVTISALNATGLFACVATIVWKQTEQGWKEARWHVSLLSADIPSELAAAS